MDRRFLGKKRCQFGFQAKKCVSCIFVRLKPSQENSHRFWRVYASVEANLLYFRYGGSARFIPAEGNGEMGAPSATLEESAEGDVSFVVQEEGRVDEAGVEHDRRKKEQWERRQTKKTRVLETRKTHILDEAMQSPIEVAVPAPELTEQAPLFEPDETPTYQDLPAVQGRWTGRVAPRKRRRNLKRTVGPEPLPLPSKPPSRAS